MKKLRTAVVAGLAVLTGVLTIHAITLFGTLEVMARHN